jgi:hypothetical protein
MRSRGGDRLIVGVYANDLIITDISKEIIVTFKLEMKDRCQMSDLGLCNIPATPGLAIVTSDSYLGS